jgi:hypothetical protein
MLRRLRERAEWRFFAVLPRAGGGLALAWWAVLLLRGVLPASFAVAMGALVASVQRGESLVLPLAVAGVVFVLLQVLTPIHQAISANLGSRVAAWLYDRLTEACVRPAGMGHLEDPELATDLTVAREFDAGMTGPPMHINMDFIAGGLVQVVVGLASAAVLLAYAWWAPILLAGAWLATHWLLRESAVWQDRNTAEVRAAQRHAEYAYRLAVDPPAAKELRPRPADWAWSDSPENAARPGTRPRACGRGRSRGACSSWVRPTSSSSGRWPPPRRRAVSTSARWSPSRRWRWG